MRMVNTIVIVVALAGCGSDDPVAPAPPTETAAPATLPPQAPDNAEVQPDPAQSNLRDLKNATYTGIEILEGPVTLVDGKWEGEPFDDGGASRPEVVFLRDFFVSGNLDADANEEYAVLLSENSGGSGTRTYLAVMDRQNGALVNVATRLIGDRVQIRKVWIENKEIYLSVVQAGVDDALCCPGELMLHGWMLEPDGWLNDFIATTQPGRLSLDVLSDTGWELAAWDFDEPVAGYTNITLTYADGRIAGSGGCNQYSAPATDGETPGDVNLEPAVATRMACEPPIMETENRYFECLNTVIKYGFIAGQLALTYHEEDGTIKTLLFDEVSPKSGDPWKLPRE